MYKLSNPPPDLFGSSSIRDCKRFVEIIPGIKPDLAMLVILSYTLSVLYTAAALLPSLQELHKDAMLIPRILAEAASDVDLCHDNMQLDLLRRAAR